MGWVNRLFIDLYLLHVFAISSLQKNREVLIYSKSFLSLKQHGLIQEPCLTFAVFELVHL